MKVFEASIVYTETLFEVENSKLSTPEEVYSYMKGVVQVNPCQETFWVIFLNTRNKPLGRHLVTTGTATAALCHPREVFKGAILANATNIICSHVHPSGDPSPSSADIAITKQLKKAGEILGINVVDHIILGDPKEDPMGKGWYSFRFTGLL